MGHESLNIWGLGFRLFCSAPHGFFRGKINTRGILPNQKTWSSFMSSLCHYVRDRDGVVSLTGCSHETEKSASLTAAQPKAGVWIGDNTVAKAAEWAHTASLLPPPVQRDAQLHRSWAVSLTTALLFGSYTSASLPPSLGLDAKFKNHFKNLERGRCSLLDKQLRTCGEDAWNDWWW